MNIPRNPAPANGGADLLTTVDRFFRSDRPGRQAPLVLCAGCFVCVGPAVGCWVSTTGAHHCRRVGDFMPGFVIVGRGTDATAFRTLSTVPAAPGTRDRLRAWLAQHGPDVVTEARAALERAEGAAA